MGSESQAKRARKAQVIHRSKFAGGRYTPEELHRAVGIRKRCVGCGLPAAMRIRVFVPLKELTEKCPEFVAQIMATNPKGAQVPVTPMKFGANDAPVAMVRMSDVGACSLCRKSVEQAAARGPGGNFRGINYLVEIENGPGADKPMVQVPGSFGGEN